MPCIDCKWRTISLDGTADLWCTRYPRWVRILAESAPHHECGEYAKGKAWQASHETAGTEAEGDAHGQHVRELEAENARLTEVGGRHMARAESLERLVRDAHKVAEKSFMGNRPVMGHELTGIELAMKRLRMEGGDGE